MAELSLTIFDSVSKWRCNKLQEALTKSLTASMVSTDNETTEMTFGQESFTILDTQKDDVLDEEEITQYLKQCGISSYNAEQKARSLIKNTSTDGVIISKQDWVRSHISKILASQHVQRVQFDKIDKEQNGSITIENLLSRFQDLSRSDFSDIQNETDIDLNNGITFEEFQRIIQFEPAVTFSNNDYDKTNDSDSNQSDSDEIDTLISNGEEQTANVDTEEDVAEESNDDMKWMIACVAFIVMRYISVLIGFPSLIEINSIWSGFDEDEIQSQCNGEIDAFTYNKKNSNDMATPDEHFMSYMFYTVSELLLPWLVFGFYTYRYGCDGKYWALKPLKFAAMISFLTSFTWMYLWAKLIVLNSNALKHCDESTDIYQGTEDMHSWFLPLAIIDLCLISAPFVCLCAVLAYWCATGLSS